jgi:hypothetical protein
LQRLQRAQQTRQQRDQQQQRHAPHFHFDRQLRKDLSLQSHHLRHEVAHREADKAGVEHKHEVLIDEDAGYAGAAVAEDEESGDFVGLSDDVEVRGREEREEADGEHHPKQNVGDRSEYMIDFIQRSFKFGIIPNQIDIMICLSYSICYFFDVFL